MMRFRLNLLALIGLGLLALPALAQPPEKPADNPPAGDPAMKQKLLDAFDTNKDGMIDRSEARSIGRALRENFDVGPGPGPGPGGPEGRGPQGRRRPDGPPPGDGPGDRGPERRRGHGPDDGPGDRNRGPEGWGRGPDGPPTPPRPPRPEQLFNRFDENNDESLSKDEFKKLSEFVREHRPMGPPLAWRDGPGRDGPPPRGEFDRRGGEGRRRGWWREGPPGPPPEDGPPPEVAPGGESKEPI